MLRFLPFSSMTTTPINLFTAADALDDGGRVFCRLPQYDIKFMFTGFYLLLTFTTDIITAILRSNTFTKTQNITCIYFLLIPSR